MQKIIALVLVAVLDGCASHPMSITHAASVEARTRLAGGSLACAGQAQSRALILGVLSGAAMVTGSAVTIAGGADLAPVSYGLMGASVLGGAATIAFAATASQYTEQAGLVLAGVADVGGCGVEVSEDAPRPAPIADVQKQMSAAEAQRQADILRAKMAKERGTGEKSEEPDEPAPIWGASPR